MEILECILVFKKLMLIMLINNTYQLPQNHHIISLKKPEQKTTPNAI